MWRLFGDKSFGKTEQVEQNQGDQECSGVERVGCSLTRVFRESFLEKETVEQKLEGGKGLAMHGERGDGACRGLDAEMCLTQLLLSSQSGWAEGALKEGRWEMGDGRCSGEGRKQGIPSLVNHGKSITQLPDLEERERKTDLFYWCPC